MHQKYEKRLTCRGGGRMCNFITVRSGREEEVMITLCS
jgi:hypothetical protein